MSAKLAAHARKMSDALLKVRPLGGSELFSRVGDEFYADPVRCGAEIDRMRTELQELRKEVIVLRREKAWKQ